MRKTTLIKSMAVFAVFVMLAANATLLAAPNGDAADESKGTLNYVALGDSAVNGYGVTEYYPENAYDYYGFEVKLENNYPSLLAKLFESQGYDVDYRQLAVSGTRSLDLRYMLEDGFDGDSVTVNEVIPVSLVGLYGNTGALKNFNVPGYEKSLSGLREYYQDSIKQADIITYQFNSDFTYTYMEMIEGIINGEIPEEQFDLFYDAELMQMMDDAREFISGHIVKLVQKAGISPAQTEKVLDALSGIISATAYAITIYDSSFDNNMKYILSANPKAKVIVLDSTNYFSNINIVCNGVTVPLGQLYGVVQEYCNLYAQYMSPYSMMTYHVNVDNPASYAAYIVDDGANAPNEVKNMVAYALLQNADPTALRAGTSSIIPANGYVMYDLIDGISFKFSEFIQYVVQSNNIDLSSISDIGDIMNVLGPKIKEAIGVFTVGDCSIAVDERTGDCTIVSPGKTIKFTGGEMALMNLYIGYISANGVLAHPSETDHALIAGYLCEFIAANKVMEKPAGYPAFMDPDSAKTIDDTLQEYKEVSIKVVTDKLREMLGYLDENWDTIVNAAIGDAYLDVKGNVDDAYEYFLDFKAQVIIALEKMLEDEGLSPTEKREIENAIQFLEDEKYSLQLYGKILAALLESKRNMLDESAVIEQFAQKLYENWDDVMKGIASGEYVDDAYQAVLNSILDTLNSIKVDQEIAEIIAELQDIQKKLNDMDADDAKALIKPIMDEIDAIYQDYRPYMNEQVEYALDVIKTIIKEILGEGAPESEMKLASALQDLEMAVLEDCSWVLKVSANSVQILNDYLKTELHYEGTELDEIVAALTDAENKLNAYIASEPDLFDVKQILDASIDILQKAIEAGIVSVVSALDKASAEVDQIALGYVDNIIAQCMSVAQLPGALADFITSTTQNIDKFYHIAELKAQIKKIVQNDFPTEKQVSQLKILVNQLYATVLKTYDACKDDIPEEYREAAAKAVADLKAIVDSFNKVDITKIKADIIAYLDSTAIEDELAKEIKAVAEQVRTLGEQAKAYVDSAEFRAYITESVQPVLDTLDTLADTLAAMGDDFDEIDVQAFIDKLQAIVDSYFAGDEDAALELKLLAKDMPLSDPELIAIMDGVESDTDASMLALADYIENFDLKAYLLKLVDDAETACKNVQAAAAKAVNDLSAAVEKFSEQIDKEKQTLAQYVADQCKKTLAGIDAIAGYVADVAVNPDNYFTYIPELKAQIKDFMNTSLPTEEQFTKLKAGVKSFYDNAKLAYDVAKSDIPKEYQPIIENALKQLKAFSDKIQPLAIADVKAAITEFFDGQEIEKMIGSELQIVIDELNKLKKLAETYIDDEVRPVILAQIDKIIAEVKTVAAVIGQYGAAIEGIDMAPYFQEIRDIIEAEFAIDRDSLKMALDVVIPELETAIASFGDDAPDCVRDLRSAYNVLMTLRGSMDRYTDAQIEDMVAEFNKYYEKFEYGYLQYGITEIEVELQALIAVFTEYLEGDFLNYIDAIVKQIKECTDVFEQYLQEYDSIIDKIKEILQMILEIESDDIMQNIDNAVKNIEAIIEEDLSAAVLAAVKPIVAEIQKAIDAIGSDATEQEIKAELAKIIASVEKAKEFQFSPYFQEVGAFIKAIHDARIYVTENGINFAIIAAINASEKDIDDELDKEIQKIKDYLKSETFQKYVADLDAYLTELEQGEIMFTGELNKIAKLVVIQYEEGFDAYKTIKPVLDDLYKASGDAEELKDVFLGYIEKALEGSSTAAIISAKMAFVKLYDSNTELFMTFASGLGSVEEIIEADFDKAAPFISWLKSRCTYNVTWIDQNGQQVQYDENVRFSEVPEYKGQIPEPVKTKDTVKEYVWVVTYDKNVDAIRTLTYTEHPRLYDVTWVDGDNNVIYTGQYAYGEVPEFDFYEYGVPTKKSSGGVDFEFLGWNTNPRYKTALDELPAVTKDAKYYAVFEKSDTRNLVIHYVFSDKTQAAPDYEDKILVGEKYLVMSPTISGYTAMKPFITGTMGENGKEVTVKYVKR
jgi:hypothetical protein